MKLEQREFERLALEQIDLLYRVARRLTRDPNRAEDLVQETYLRALRSRDGFNLEEFGMKPWLLRILYNLHVSRSQREGRQPATMDDLELAGADRRSASLPIDGRSFEGMDEQLVRAIDGLSQEYQSVLLLWAVDDFSYKEIAETLDIPIGTVMSRLHRVRQKLSEELHEYAVEARIVRAEKE
ncbi:MAG TPA: sigma-70 family RNA polymerase sigma factor [Tepidisphaeraceae bacterium]|jgi:RNA polymerase sigma-70 factor (ECF subfamily)|nr:sigma-70 family RNA polymerase sigma factor [Tepidisphaeraceae bacterium]